MPETDFVEVDIVLAPKAVSRASLGIGMILHTLTDDQDDEFGVDRSVLLLEASWEDTLDDLGIVDGEEAFEDVRAHFSQAKKPDRAYLGRRGDPTGTQVKKLTFADAGGGLVADGTYRLINIEGGPYEFVAAASTLLAAQTALLATIGAGTHPSFTEAASGGDAIDMTAAAVGTNIPMTLEVPSAGAAVLAITTQAKEVKRAETVDVTFGGGSDGLYTMTVKTTTGQKIYQRTEGSGTGTGATQAAAFKVLYDADPSDLFGATATVVGPTFTIVAAVAGTPGAVTIATPLSDATVSRSVTNYNIADDIQLVVEANPNWYVLINGSHIAIDIEQAAEKIEAERKLHVGQSSDADIRTTVATDLFSRLQDAQRGRSAGVEHPVNGEGVSSAWAGGVPTLVPGKVNWTAQVLSGFTGQNFPNRTEAANIFGKEGSYLERYDARGQDIMSGGYAFDGRPFDLRRAIDTFAINVENALFDLLVVNEIIPYSNEGIVQGEAVIRTEFEQSQIDGYGISLDLTVPDIADADSGDQIRGIWPPFTGHVVMQVGTYKIKANFTVSQEQI